MKAHALFQLGENRKSTLTTFKNIFSRTKGQITTKFSTKCPLVKGIQVCSNKGLYLFLRGDINKICDIWNSFFLQNHWVKFSKTWNKVSFGENEASLFKCPFPRGDNDDLTYIYNHSFAQEIIARKCFSS